MSGHRERAYLENLNHAAFPAPGPFNIPRMRPCREVLVEHWIPFNQAASTPREKRRRAGVHFWLEDYFFKRVWEQPGRYAELLRQFGAVMSPEFSIYEDFPGAVRIYNVYRNAWLGRYWQEQGITVVPCVLFALDPGTDYCWLGYPERSILAVSSVGCMNSEAGKAWFIRGYQEMIERLDPLRIIFYGKVPEACQGPLVTPVESFSQSLYRRLG